MTSYNQDNTATGLLTDDMDALFSQMTADHILSASTFFGGYIIVMDAGYTMTVTGTGLSMTGGPGTWAFSGTVQTINFSYTSVGTTRLTLSNVDKSFASVFAPGTALFSGVDALSGGFGSNALYGYGGNDQFYGGANGPNPVNVHDTLYGGDGDDTFNLTILGDPTEADSVVFGGAGNDQLLVEWSNLGDAAAILDGDHLTTLPQSVERLRFTAMDFVGGQVIFHKATLNATPGQGYLAMQGLVQIEGLKQINAKSAGTIDLSAIAMTGEGNSFRYNGSSGADVFVGPLSFSEATDISYYGYAGNDTLTARADAVERLIGSEGDDTYTVGANDVIEEFTGEGNDTVQRSLTTHLSAFANIEHLTLLGTAAIDGTGNAGNNIITGNAGANYLSGGGGLDTLRGAGGSDTYLIEAGVTVVEGVGAGTDTALSFATALLAANVERLVLLGSAAANGTGNALANRITGNEAANRLDGGALADTLIGDDGDDTYVFGAGDVIVEFADGGTDTVESAVSLTLADEVEHLFLTGAAAINGTGNALANRITGNSAANTLDGQAGIDTLIGGLGNDVYLVGTGDVIIEAAGSSADRLRADSSYVLASGVDVEALETVSASATVAINLTGNALAQTLTGNAGDNVLTGLGGADTMVGGAGNDIYFAETGDVITENVGGGTADRLRAGSSFVLGNDTNIEFLETALPTGTAAINLTGNALAQTLTGNAGANVLNGGAGNDVLTGGAGNDAFVFSTALGLSNLDRITDFSHVADTIRLDNAVFTGLGANGALAAGAFWFNATGLAHDASDRLIFNVTTGALHYDSNGSAAGGGNVKIAQLTVTGVLDYTDFQVI